MKNKRVQLPNIYNFIVAAASDQKAASQMLRDKPDWLHTKSSIGETALHYLVIENDIEAVKFLIDKGAEVDNRDDWGGTPLMHAAQLGHVDMCLLLMEKGADVNAKDNVMDWTPLHFAARSGKADLLDSMLLAGGHADAQGEFGESVADVVLPRKRELLLTILKKHGYN
jgi:ankyrin repeat protein